MRAPRSDVSPQSEISQDTTSDIGSGSAGAKADDAVLASTRLRDASNPPIREGFVCASCGRFNVTAVEGLFARRRAGSPQRFCNPTCRQAAYRRRCASVPEDMPRQASGGRRRRLKEDPSQQDVPTQSNAKPNGPLHKEAV
jgi:hypothetical protein